MKKSLFLALVFALSAVANAAVVTRYFGVTAVGTGDGTSWENRAALLNSGSWSSVLTSFGFSTDGLLCVVEPGDYTCTQPLTAAVLGTPDPSASFPLVLCAADAAGNPVFDIAPWWTSDMPDWDTTNVPRITFNTGNTLAITVSNVLFCSFKLVGNGRTSGFAFAAGFFRCIVVSTASATTASVLNWLHSECIIRMEGTAYDCVVSTANSDAHNVRVQGNPAATSGNRVGYYNGTNAAVKLNRVTIIDNPGNGYWNVSTSVSNGIVLQRCNIINNGGDGLSIAAGAVASLSVVGGIITGNGGWGINFNGNTVLHTIERMRMRDNALGNRSPYTVDASRPHAEGTCDFSDGYPDQATADAAEFADAVAGDFRVKAGGPLATKSHGISVARPTVAY